ncbi:MAG: hypothetical protein M3Z30_02120 [Gemmatimonadota bacterium]|nr:hypothetical protein [Gemmatimonadota bacterium]
MYPHKRDAVHGHGGALTVLLLADDAVGGDVGGAPGLRQLQLTCGKAPFYFPLGSRTEARESRQNASCRGLLYSKP